MSAETIPQGGAELGRVKTHRHPPDGYAFTEESTLEPITNFNFEAVDRALGLDESGERFGFDPEFAGKAQELWKILHWLSGARDLDAMAGRAFVLVWTGAPELLPDRTLKKLAERLGVTPALLTTYLGKLRRELCDGRNPGGHSRTDTARENMRQAALKKTAHE
jgi:hypothetical protein